jgi:hypothetical protein
VNRLVERQRIARVIIVADNDTPGQRGAVRLQESLRVPSLVWTPPCKDIRELVRLGGDARMIYGAVEDMVWTMPEKGTR